MRIPYGVKCNINGKLCKVTRVDVECQQVYLKKDDKHGGTYSIARGDVIKPYLRPMSSMTEEEEKEYIDIVNYKGGLLDYALAKSRNEKYSIPTFTCCIQWLLKRHFDVNNLIPMGLALPAPEGMYNK